jgi:hypothetical protein
MVVYTMQNTSKTRAGLVPATSNEIPFDITTEKAQAYLSDRIASVINKVNAASEKNKQREIPEIALATSRFSTKFAPLVVAFSMDALDKKNSYNVPDIFNPEPDDNSVKLREEIYSVIYPYLYNSEDCKAFFTNQSKHDLLITTKAAREIKAASRFSIAEEKDGGRKVRYVQALIDPLRLFHDMLTTDGAKEKFSVRIVSVEKIHDVNYRYKVMKQFKKGGAGPEKATIAKYLAKSIHK